MNSSEPKLIVITVKILGNNLEFGSKCELSQRTDRIITSPASLWVLKIHVYFGEAESSKTESTSKEEKN